MSKYTTEVRYICENYAGLDSSMGYGNVKEIISKAIGKVFDFDFPIFDEAYRSVIETKILKHFYTREIGAETVGLWKLWLDTRLNEIMPYYNKLYESELIKYNPIYDKDITTTHNRKNDGTKKDIGVRTGNGGTETDATGNTHTVTSDDINDWNYYSDTPQGSVGNLASLEYLTNATHNTSDRDIDVNTNTTDHNESTYTNTENNTLDSLFGSTEEYTEHVVGKTSGVSYSKLIQEFRESLLNIDVMIINDLNDLFLNLW